MMTSIAQTSHVSHVSHDVYSLLVYTRTPTCRQEANNADIALSAHFALRSPITGEWQPLNENYGICFARGVSDSSDQAALKSGAACRVPGKDVHLKSLKDPFIGRAEDGTFVLMATRTDRGGVSDGSEKDSVLLLTSADLLSWTDRGVIRFHVSSPGVHHPHFALTASGSYEVMWRSDRGQVVRAIMSELNQAAADQATVSVVNDHDDQSEAAGVAVSAEYPADDLSVRSIPDIVPGNAIAISEAEARRLITRFGRIYNTSVAVPDLEIANSAAGTPRTPVSASQVDKALSQARVKLTYSDGSVDQRAVQWDESAEQVAARLNNQVDGISIHGHIRHVHEPVPFAVQRADPSIFAWNWNGKQVFLFTATEDQDGNCIDPVCGPHLPIRMADTILDLSDVRGGRAREVDLLRAGDRNSEGRKMTGCFWAPEFHIIDGKLSILFMPCFDNDGKPDMWTGHCHIMQLKKDATGHDLNPTDPSNWTVPEPILRRDGSELNPLQHISLDMTYFEDSGHSYYAWQQVGSVWIARVDPKHPTRLTSDPVQVIVPEFAWDNTIAEGPFVISHDGKLFLIYSGSLVGIDYTTGLATAPAGAGADLTDPASWTKLNYPLQKSGIYNGAWQLGTGHGMFSHDEDGNLIYVFHAANNRDGIYHGRDAQVRRVHWAADGMPILDMQEDEEVAPHLREVTARIRVR
jgi:GH43 family beta-xylosidase